MNQPDKLTQEKPYMELAIDIAIRIGVLALLIAWCFQILRPFITPVIWGTTIGIALYPVSKFSRRARQWLCRYFNDNHSKCGQGDIGCGPDPGGIHWSIYGGRHFIPRIQAFAGMAKNQKEGCQIIGMF